MPKQAPQGPSYLDEHHERIASFADEYFDDPEERESFVDTLMERRGYQRTTGWSLPQAPEPDPQAAAGAAPVQPPGPKRPSYFKRA